MEEGEEEDEDIPVPASPASPASPVRPGSPASPVRNKPASPTVPEKPAVPADPEPEVVQPNPAQPEPVQPDPVASEPRRSGWSSVPPSRLEVTGNGKSYAAVVSTGITRMKASPRGKGCGPSVPVRREGVHSVQWKCKVRRE